MGKIRVATLGNEEQEKKLKAKAEARREAKKAEKKSQVKGIGLKGGQRVNLVEGLDEEAMKKLETLEQKSFTEENDTEGKKEKKSKAKKEARKRSKRYQEALSMIDRTKNYSITDALELLKKTSLTRFDGTVEMHIALNPKTLKEKSKEKKEKGVKEKSEKASLRGTVTFPHSTGKTVRVAIANDAVLAQIEKGIIEFDVLVTNPLMMPKLAKFARTLGPKGLMPNPKNGTIGENPEELAKKLSSGQTNFKTEPDNPLIHMAIGKVSFETSKLQDNIQALVTAVNKNKIERITLSATMGPGIKVDVASL